jgi:hypothetical protein
MNLLIWTAVGWAALSVLAIPLIVRFCRCMARFDPPLEQLAASTVAALGNDVLRSAGRRPGAAGRSGETRRSLLRSGDDPSRPSPSH